mgnify:FL=1|tara:strand:- start:799 stop:1026 length:228 start_codon:yes stop_codon:yes gene_type:complete
MVVMAYIRVKRGVLLRKRGKVVELSQYRKDKVPAKVEQLNLADYFKVGTTIVDLNESERNLINDSLKRTLGPNPK